MIEYLKIRNFKSIKEADTNLPFFGAIVGMNAAGKTNIIQAIDFTRDLIMNSSAATAQSKITLTPFELFNLNDTSRQLSLSFRISDAQDRKYIFNYTLGLELRENEPPSLLVVHERLQRFSGEMLENVYVREDGKITNNAGSVIPLDIDGSKLVLALYRDNQVLHVKNIFAKTNILQDKTPDSRESFVNLTEEGLAALIVRLKYKNQTAYEQFEEIAKKIVPSFSTSVIRSLKEEAGAVSNVATEKDLYLVLLEEKNLRNQLSMKLISAGDLRTLLFIANALFMESGTCLMIEEIENGVHPSRVKKLLDHLETISRQKKIQMLFTTHSPSVINKFRPAEVLYVKKTNDQGTTMILLDETREITSIQELLSKGGELTDYINSRL